MASNVACVACSWCWPWKAVRRQPALSARLELCRGRLGRSHYPGWIWGEVVVVELLRCEVRRGIGMSRVWRSIVTCGEDAAMLDA